MRNVLYPKLAATNIKKNGKTYFPYLLTCILTVMMFYDLLLVSTNSALDTMPGASQLRLILNFAVTITGGFSAIFLFYTNSFLVRQRKNPGNWTAFINSTTVRPASIVRQIG